MTPRSIRRAAERRQRKLLKKQNRALAMAAWPDEAAFLSEPKIQENDPVQHQQSAPVASAVTELLENPNRPHPEIDPPLSEARLRANRANAQLSTGPTSCEGKAKSSLNAVKTGLTGRTVLLPTDDAAAYQRHVSEFSKEFQPVGPRESALVQSIADTFWRLDRIRSLEWTIFAHGHTQFAEKFAHEDASARPARLDEPALSSEAKTLLAELHTFVAYEKQLRNLHIQEARLLRRREKESAELRDLQKQRHQREQEQVTATAKLPHTPRERRAPSDPTVLDELSTLNAPQSPATGFEFSTLHEASILKSARETEMALPAA